MPCVNRAWQVALDIRAPRGARRTSRKCAVGPSKGRRSGCPSAQYILESVRVPRETEITGTKAPARRALAYCVFLRNLRLIEVRDRLPIFADTAPWTHPSVSVTGCAADTHSGATLDKSVPRQRGAPREKAIPGQVVAFGNQVVSP